jgi:hypothetical protein
MGQSTRRATEYQRDIDRVLDQLEDTAWKADKLEAIWESVTGAARKYSASKRQDSRGLADRKIFCVADEIIWLLQCDIDARTRARKGRS